MKFLCLAYGDEAGWNALSDRERQEVLAADDVIRRQGHFASAVRPVVTSVRNWGGQLKVAEGGQGQSALPLAGFSVIEADSVDDVVQLVKDTPCARAQGVIEIRPLWDLSASPSDG